LKADLVRVHHMLDATREALEFSTNKTRLDLDTDRMLCLSLVHLLEIIGEAAVAISSEFKEKYPQIPWSGIMGMRNRLIHGYYDINLDIVWETVKENIPPLKAELEKIIEHERSL
jgi:uncharacterized protein with HEPN domain